MHRESPAYRGQQNGTISSMDSTPTYSATGSTGSVSYYETENQTATVYIRISIPELKVQKCLQFELDDTVWIAKHRVYDAFSKIHEFRDLFNYGLYCPPTNGRAGKFLDDERLIREYPLQGPIGFLEFKKKRKVYKVAHLNQKKLKQLHTKSNLRHFLEHVKHGNIEKVEKFFAKGLDPNYHDQERGETPLILCTALQGKRCRDMIACLINGGGHLDFRNKKGLSAMHKASIIGNMDAMKTLLDLGASANYKDPRQLTPLYHAVMSGTNTLCTEMLLQERCFVGTQDEQGWSECHQACHGGHVKHLEQLIFYGANMDLQNVVGNTPLHICAADDQESCARLLLFRGANHTIVNYNNKTAYEVAMIAGNTTVADVFHKHKPENVVPFKEMPKFSSRRKIATITPSIQSLLRCRSDPRLNSSILDDHVYASSSDHSLSHNSNMSDPGSSPPSRGYNSDSPRSLSISSAGSLSGTKERDHGFWDGPHGTEFWRDQNSPGLPRLRRAGSLGDLNTAAGDIHRNTLATLIQSQNVSVPRTVVLQKGHEGYGFVLRGAKSHSATGNIDFQPTPEFPALQYLDSVDMGSQADRAGLKPGDFILEINGEKVIRATHERVVHLIKSSGARLTLTVVTVRSVDRSSDWFVHQDGSMTLPSRKKQAPAPPRRDPDTSLSYSKARARSMAEGLAEIEKLDQALLDYDKDDKSEYKVASIRARPISKRNTVALEDVTVHANENNHMSPSELRIKKYHRKTSAHQPFERSKSTPDLVPAGEIVNTREIIYDTPMVQEGKSNTSPVHVSLGHSRRDSENSVSSGGSNHHIYAAPGSYVASLGRSNKLSNVESVRHSISTGIYVDSVAPGKDNSRFAIRKTSTSTGSENSTPVPRRPAPPPPKQSSAPELPVRDLLNQEVVKISTPSHSAYANVSADIQKQKKAEETIYESSFRPGTLARLNNNPKGKAVGQQSTQSSEHTSTEQRTKKNSMLVADEISQNSTKHHEEYYEPEPDYESDEDKKRKSAIKHQVLVHTENNMNKTSKGSASPVLSYSVTARKQSETIVSDNTRNSVITSTSHVNNRSPMNNLSNTTSARKPSITVISIGNKDSDTSPRRKSLSSETVLKSSEERAHLGLDNSAINNRRKSGSDSMNGVPFINNYIIPPKPSQPPPAPPVSTIENGHISPPPTEPPPPPPLPPPIPFSEQSTDSHFSQSQKKPQPQSSPLVSLEDIRKAAALRQSRIETEGLKITETTDKPPVVKDGKELKKEQNQAALLAAIAKRREILSKTDENDIVDQIENRLQKTKKLQSAKLYFSSDAISKKNDSPDSPTNSDSVNKSDVTKSNSDKISDQKVFVIDKKQTIPLVKNKTNMKQNVQPPSSENKKLTAINAQNSTATSIKPQPVSDTNGKNKMSPVTSDNKQSDPSSSDFLALAEKARQDWLLKKSQAPKPDSTKGLNVEVTAVKNMGKTSEVNSIKSRIANFESSKSSENQYSVNGSTVDDSVTEDDIRKVSSIAPPPPGFDDHTVHIELVSSSSSYQNEADVNKHVSGFSQDDNSSLVSSLSTLSTLSSEHENNHLDVIAPPPPGFDDSSDIKKSQQPSSELGVKNGKPFNSKPLDTWLCIDVIDWLDDLHLSQYKKSFSQNCIDGKKLLSLNRDGFIELGVNQVGHRMNLERSIKKLTMNSG